MVKAFGRRPLADVDDREFGGLGGGYADWSFDRR
jgi:hypothetical protein